MGTCSKQPLPERFAVFCSTKRAEPSVWALSFAGIGGELEVSAAYGLQGWELARPRRVGQPRAFARSWVLFLLLSVKDAPWIGAHLLG